MKIKICCVSSLDEARMAVNAGADAIGLVSAMPSGPGVIPEDLIGEISAWASGHVETFLLTSLQIAGRIIAQQRPSNPSGLTGWMSAPAFDRAVASMRINWLTSCWPPRGADPVGAGACR